jgi:hypothetical protein
MPKTVKTYKEKPNFREEAYRPHRQRYNVLPHIQANTNFFYILVGISKEMGIFRGIFSRPR